ncbi:hypothetical protein A2767_07625 [Candidatus Roizmanbacteria bacterium RIFCSPHIGHO2_01_FULL_35_10]|uniref:PIG-L family deacetylase n=1 Tax=Candidatus Roizmanbacteria bacterium RIFCSPLOWO2_01_FULL_35_13 TaxID=1802055 RepID=A0A1F7ICP9_9BACT|nr:MAG: hypothetical protein A2767_07625 [Candidatus Roizmanbacteria bacterium RIFCSPHIGHO2_01_FULL_35_10]OGK41137.1 MAG: hypothetical protein A3A74_02225 [Candidatus Roizmanbacteria bacterium RIFCSPLOWO2_01_FULL_35_13]
MRRTEYIIKKIVKNRTRCVFISPHLDDAILSCGGLISSLRDKINMEVVSVFTRPGVRPETKFVRRFITSCGYKNSELLFADRLGEDRVLFKKLGVSFKYLSFIDAVWRKKRINKVLADLLGRINPEFIHIYPKDQDVFSGTISSSDKITLILVEKKILEAIKDDNIVVFLPIGTGLHVDHIIIREICRKNFKKVIYWSDFPYSFRKEEDINFIKSNKLSSFEWTENIGQKKELIGFYRTQFNSLFPSGIIPLKEETYFFSEEVFHTL